MQGFSPRIQNAVGWCEKIIRISYYAMIYFLPISIALCESFAGATLFFYFIKRGLIFHEKLKKYSLIEKSGSIRLRNCIILFFKSFKPISSHLSIPIAVFIFLCALSITQSHFLTLSLKGFFFKVLQWTFLYFVFLESFKTKRQIQILLSVFLVSSAVVSVNGLTQLMTGKGFIFGHLMHQERINSSFRHPNDFGSYLIFAIPLVLSLLCLLFSKEGNERSNFKESFKKKKFIKFLGIRFFFLFLLLFLMACLGFTFSRGAWFGIILALLFLGLFEKRILFLNLLILFIFMSLFHPLLKQKRSASIISDSLETKVEMEKEEKFKEGLKTQNARQREYGTQWKELIKQKFKTFKGSGRITYWGEALSIIRDNLFLGTGINTYSQIAPQYKLKNGWGGYPHNCFLHMAAEIGLVGLLSFLWVLFNLFLFSVKNILIMKDRYLNSITLGLLAGLAGFLLHSFFDTNFYSVQLANLMWVVMGIIVAAQKIALRSQKFGSESV